MSAKIISLATFREPTRIRSVLKWERAKPGHWRLADHAGVEWATVEPYGNKRGGRGMFALPTCKATCTNEHLNRYRQRDYWVLASNIGQGKARILEYLRWAAAGVIEFEVAA
jgi:hypothetical protein